MKTQMTITMDDYLRDELKKIAKKMWTNGSNLISMMVANLVNTWEAVFSINNLKTSIKWLEWSEEFTWSKLHEKWKNILKNL